LIGILCIGIILAACQSASVATFPVTLQSDGENRTLSASQESTVSDVLTEAGIVLSDLDRVNPPGYTRVQPNMHIIVVRVTDKTVIEQETIPFEKQTSLNDSLAPGDSRLLQAGTNGTAEVTYRIVYEDGVEASRTEVRRVVMVPPQSEVVMVGSQGQLQDVAIKGTLAYISGGNAWIIRDNTANRRPLTLEGGLDGRVIFAFSDDGKHLLLSRLSQNASGPEGATATPTPLPDQPFNTLWAILDTKNPESKPIQLNLKNILYAAWLPGSNDTFVYSTGEPRSGYPGWQANNDLWRARMTNTGTVRDFKLLLQPSSGGVYGWYGTIFEFSPDGVMIGWAQADAVGILKPPADEGDATRPNSYESETLITFTPRNAFDFVWVPRLSWSPDGKMLLTTTHGDPVGSEFPEDSPVFNVAAASRTDGYNVTLVERAGMWAAPVFSPVGISSESNEDTLIAYLQAIDPLNSQVSLYRLVVMDRDGSNPRTLFPPEDQPGLIPQTVAWSPDGKQIALIYQGNLYLIDILTGLTQQITSDGLSSNPRWLP
jgi:hypothetical protein